MKHTIPLSGYIMIDLTIPLLLTTFNFSLFTVWVIFMNVLFSYFVSLLSKDIIYLIKMMGIN